MEKLYVYECSECGEPKGFKKQLTGTYTCGKCDTKN